MKVSTGSGSCVSHRASEGGKYNLPEGKEIWVQYWGTTLNSSEKPESPFVNDH
ncbi:MULTISPECIES: hypothetical protein [Amycolatopsis]